jgi:RsiW-degrading membrane proteinase PrsW (M82 family)
MTTLSHFLDGAMVAFCLGIAAFQIKFWRRTSDRLFLGFAVSFLLMAVNRSALTAATTTASESTTYLYLIRLVAFVIIIVAIVDKNRSKKNGNHQAT